MMIAHRPWAVLAGLALLGLLGCPQQPAAADPPKPPAATPPRSAASTATPDPPSSTAAPVDNTDAPDAARAQKMYRWKRTAPGYQALAARFPAPKGFVRVPARRGSYAHWLRHLPLRPEGTNVLSYRGDTILKADDPRLAAVVDLDLSDRDRQQCADTVMRLRGEYLASVGRADRIAFRWAGGKRFGFAQWRRGIRPQKRGRRWEFVPKNKPWSGHRSVRAYLEFMFSWTGSLHMAGEPRVKPDDLRPGDFFIKGGSPGHVVVILDVARDGEGRRRALVGQGFMPAQDMHVLRGPSGDPWFIIDPPRPVVTPFWRPFPFAELRRFRY